MKKILFTTLFSDDLGLLTRTLPIARELAKRGHRVAFCNPAYAPARLIEEAGFENLPFKHPVFYLNMSGKPDLKNFFRLAKSGQMKMWRLCSPPGTIPYQRDFFPFLKISALRTLSRAFLWQKGAI